MPPKDLSRRQFLTRAGGAAIAMPSLAAILAACSKPGTASVSGAGEIPIATLENPVTLPMSQDPIAADTPIESGPLILYNWADYIWKPVVHQFEDQFGVSVDITTFNNLEEGIQKVVNGQVSPDVFVPTPGYLRRLVQKDLLQPLQHELIPNMEANVWPIYSNPGSVLRPRMELHRSLHDLHVGGRVSPRPGQRRRGRGPGLERAVEQRLQRRDQPVRLLRRHDRDHDPAQRQPRSEYGRSRADRCRQGGDPADDQRQLCAPHDQRGLRQDPRGRLHSR